MNFRRLIFSAAFACAVTVFPQFCSAQNSLQQTMTCSSNNNQRNYCRIDNNGVRVNRVLANTCNQNNDWGYDNRGVWVDHGCSAEFIVNTDNNGSYNNGGYNNNQGTYNNNGGYNNQGTNNSGNNRYGYGRHRDRGNSANTYSLRCDSGNNGQQNYCPADARGGVHIVREYSSNGVCRQGQTWGYDSGGVWVSNGCSADFEVDGYGNNTGIYNGRTTTIPSGTEVQIRSDEPIDSKTAYAGQRYAADVAQDVTDSNGQVIIPRGSQAELILHDQNYNNNTNNNNNNQNLVIDLDSVTVNGQRYIVSTKDVTSSGSGIGANKKTGEYVGGGALLGAIIGAVAGGGKGAAIGAAVGAGAGAGGVVLTKGKDIKVPVETVMKFKLDQDLTLQAVR